MDPQDPTSPWLTARPKALRAVRKIFGHSDYGARKGVTASVNSVYWVEPVLKRPDGLVVVRNLTEGAKIKADEVTEPMEPDLLYPLLRGRDVQRWRAEPSALILLTHEPGMRLKAIPEKELQTRYPRTYGYLKRFEKVLRSSAIFRRYFTRKGSGGEAVMETGAFYSIFNVGDYTFADWKVVWREIASELTASVVGCQDNKPIVPDHKLVLVPCVDSSEAHFICALLNSALVRFAALGYSIQTQFAPHLLDYIRIPRYDPSEPLHQRLAELSDHAHEAARAGEEKRLKELEAEIDRQAARLWGLTDEELREIQQNLHELAGETAK